MIEIIGYITKSYGDSFTLKITNDNVENENGNHPEVSKEAGIYIASNLFPNDWHTQFVEVKNTYQKKELKACYSISRELKKGDRVKCSVFIVDTNFDNEGKIYLIDTNPIHIESYTKFKLWLYPHPESFKRLEVDTPETLKFRRQNYYVDINQKKYEKITGSKWGCEKKWWINKNPKITFPMLWEIQVKTTVSNLWKRFTKQENLPKSSLITNIILAFTTAISILIAIWSLFFKNP